MRPNALPEAFSGRPRKPSLPESQAGVAQVDSRNAGPTTYFMASEEEVEQSLAGSAETVGESSSYGVQSLADTIDFSSKERRRSESQGSRNASRRRSTIKPAASVESSIQPSSATAHEHPSPVDSTSRQSPAAMEPLASPFLTSPADGSLPSSPKSTSTQSMKQLDEVSIADDTGSQAIMSSEEEEDAVEPSIGIHDAAPQLIMPSIKMPSRRPFTDRGRQMGRFKVMVAGGKSTFASFIWS